MNISSADSSSHRSGRAAFPHPALRVTFALSDDRRCEPRAQAGEDHAVGRPRTEPTVAWRWIGGATTCARYVRRGARSSPSSAVASHAVIDILAAQFAAQLLVLPSHRRLAMSPTPGFGGAQRATQPTLRRVTAHDPVEAARSEEEAISSGKAFELAATQDNLTARASSSKGRRPKARAWRPAE